MAVVKELDQAAWQEWLKDRPQCIKEMAAKWPPDRLYLMTSGHRCTLHAYNEDGTVTVEVNGMFNRVLFARNVFGVDPAGLVECDPPEPGEDIGDTSQEAGYSYDDIENILIPRLREEIGK